MNLPLILACTCSCALRLMNTASLFHTFNHLLAKVSVAISVHVRKTVDIQIFHIVCWLGVFILLIGTVGEFHLVASNMGNTT